MAPRVRAAASACLVASGLLISGVGGAIALADPGPGADERQGTDSREDDDSVGDIVRRAFGFGDGQNTSNPWQRPETWASWCFPPSHNGRREGQIVVSRAAPYFS